MDEYSGVLNFGELTDDSFSFKHITWKVPNILSLLDSSDSKVQSPTFLFAGAVWNLVLYCGNKDDSDEHIDLLIERHHSAFQEHFIFYKIYFKTRREKIFNSFSASACFTTDFNASGVLRYIEKSRFKTMKKILAPNGVLTVNCELRTKMTAGIDKHSPLEFNTSLGLDQIKQENLPVHLHENAILKDLKELLLKQEDCDVIIKVKGKEFPAHKLLLKARSPVFASTFRNEMKEKLTDVVDIEDCDPSVFSDFLSFLYCGDKKSISTENVFSLYILADKYDVQDLGQKCVEFIKENLSVDIFSDAISLAIEYAETELIQLSADFFFKNLQEIIVTDKWQSFLAKNPAYSNDLFIKALVPDKRLK